MSNNILSLIQQLDEDTRAHAERLIQILQRGGVQAAKAAGPDDPPSSYPHPPLRIQVSPLCGPERHFWLHPDLTMAILAWSMDPRVCHPQGAFELVPAYGNETSQVGRNKACREFLAGDMDYLLMVDNDTIPRHPVTGDILNLMAMGYWGVDIVAALVPTIKAMRGEGKLLWGMNAYVLEGDGYRSLSLGELGEESPTDLRDEKGAQDARVPLKLVDAVGFGAVMLSRRVVKDVRDSSYTWLTGPTGAGTPKPEPLDHESRITPVLRSRNVDGSTSFGEDMLFCRRAIDMGYKVYTAPSLYCDHAHTIDMGKLPTMGEAGRPQPMPMPTSTSNKAATIPDPYPGASLYGLSHRVPPDYPPLPTITNWSIEPQLAIWLRKTLSQDPNINRVLELGSGISTVVIADTIESQDNPNGDLISLDHSEEHSTAVWDALTDAETGWVVLLERKLGADGFYTNWSDVNGPFDLMLIDGPPGQYNGRRHASRLFNRVREGGIIILDDADRKDEREAWRSWLTQGLVENVERVGRAAILRRTRKVVE